MNQELGLSYDEQRTKKRRQAPDVFAVDGEDNFDDDTRAQCGSLLQNEKHPTVYSRGSKRRKTSKKERDGANDSPNQNTEIACVNAIADVHAQDDARKMKKTRRRRKTTDDTSSNQTVMQEGTSSMPEEAEAEEKRQPILVSEPTNNAVNRKKSYRKQKEHPDAAFGNDEDLGNKHATPAKFNTSNEKARKAKEFSSPKSDEVFYQKEEGSFHRDLKERNCFHTCDKPVSEARKSFEDMPSQFEYKVDDNMKFKARSVPKPLVVSSHFPAVVTVKVEAVNEVEEHKVRREPENVQKNLEEESLREISEKENKEAHVEVCKVSPDFNSNIGKQTPMNEKQGLKLRAPQPFETTCPTTGEASSCSTKRPTDEAAYYNFKEGKEGCERSSKTLKEEGAAGGSLATHKGRDSKILKEMVYPYFQRKRSSKGRTTLSASQKRNEAYKRRTPDNPWMPPRSEFGLLQEDHLFDPWRVLVICMLLNRTAGLQAKRVIADLFALCPNAKRATEVSTGEIEEVIKSLGLQKKRAVMIQRFSREYLGEEWTHVTQLHGIGKYAADAYAIFCTGKWKRVFDPAHLPESYPRHEPLLSNKSKTGQVTRQSQEAHMTSKHSQEASSSSSSYPSLTRRNYDVFFSFRGEDIPKNFSDHLYACCIGSERHCWLQR